jgi:hypothetical protein
LISSEDPLDHALLRDERDAALWLAFGELRPACQRLLRVLMTDPPPSYDEAAAALDLAVGSIGPTRQRCLTCLRRLLVADELYAFDGAAPRAAKAQLKSGAGGDRT